MDTPHAADATTPGTAPGTAPTPAPAPAPAPVPGAPQAPEPLSDNEKAVMDDLYRIIGARYGSIPTDLKNNPDQQAACLELLLSADENLIPPVTRKKMIQARLSLAKIDSILARESGAAYSYWIILGVIYLFVVVIIAAYQWDVLTIGEDAQNLNKRLVMGVPTPVIVWSVIGSLTSMLLRAGKYTFPNFNEALKWVMFRPIVGVVMGIMTYLLLVAGLLVFSGDSSTQAPQLVWVIAFAGSFSDTFAVRILENLLGKFKTDKDGGAADAANASK